MKILVLGGSYFLGKHFVNQAKEIHEITVFNRGTRPLQDPKIREIHGDRHNLEDLAKLHGQSFDAVVDFCAYQQGDILSVFTSLDSKISQYLFISTCDIYERGLGRVLDENAPMETRVFAGEAGDYIKGKVALEQELVQCSKNHQVAYTSIRPVFIYGMDNYAPREGIYFHWIWQAGQILHPEDATGEFQMVYVLDVVSAILKTLGNQKAYNQAYNLAPDTMQSYASFAQALKQACPIPFETVPVSVQMVQEKNIPLPFPLTKEESNWYNGEKVLAFLDGYTPLEEGLKDTICAMEARG